MIRPPVVTGRPGQLLDHFGGGQLAGHGRHRRQKAGAGTGAADRFAQ